MAAGEEGRCGEGGGRAGGRQRAGHWRREPRVDDVWEGRRGRDKVEREDGALHFYFALVFLFGVDFFVVWR